MLNSNSVGANSGFALLHLVWVLVLISLALASMTGQIQSRSDHQGLSWQALETRWAAQAGMDWTAHHLQQGHSCPNQLSIAEWNFIVHCDPIESNRAQWWVQLSLEHDTQRFVKRQRLLLSKP